MFGMGTGGTLRLLSPETKLSLEAIAAAFLVSTLRQSNCLASAFPLFASRLFLFGFRNRLDAAFALHPPHPQNRTGDMIRPRSYLRNFFFAPTNHWLRVSFTLPRALSGLSAFPFPFSLFPFPFYSDQALDLLVSSSSIRYRTSTDDLSTLSSSRGLTSLRCGNSILQGGFTLRCLQRLSRPHFASLLCHWHDNSCTRGASIPVLSY